MAEYEDISEYISVGFSWNELQLQFTDGPVYHLLQRSDDSYHHDFTSANASERDGICDAAYLTDCPAQTILGEWTPAPYYEEDKLTGGRYISHYYYWSTSWESLIFSGDGTVTINNADGRIYEGNPYRIVPCTDSGCSDHDWNLVLDLSSLEPAWRHVLEDTVIINISGDILSIPLVGDYRVLPALIFTKASDSATEGEEVECFTE